jgi:RNA polymerase sigma-70 factor (ECF subfamily)
MVLAAPEQFIYKGTFKSNVVNQTVEEVYKQCFYEYFESLFRYAFTIVKNSAEAKDIVQTVFVKLWEKRDEVNLATSARSYLYTSVYHLCLNNVRDHKIRATHHENLVAKELLHTNPAEEKETRIRIQEAIDSLPGRCKEVFYKSRFQGKKYAEIATEMNISVKTVEAQMGKALRYLREQLADLAVVCLIYLLLKP